MVVQAMNYFQANQILDGIKDNLSYNLDTINRALWLTGDLNDIEFERSVGETGSSSCKYGSEGWLAGLRESKVTGA
jgi:hypothetical protein